MKMLTIGNTRKDFETRAVAVIKKQQNEFNFVDIYNAMLDECDSQVARDFIYGVMCEALEFCLSLGYVQFIDTNKYLSVHKNQQEKTVSV